MVDDNHQLRDFVITKEDIAELLRVNETVRLQAQNIALRRMLAESQAKEAVLNGNTEELVPAKE